MIIRSRWIKGPGLFQLCLFAILAGFTAVGAVQVFMWIAPERVPHWFAIGARMYSFIAGFGIGWVYHMYSNGLRRWESEYDFPLREIVSTLFYAVGSTIVCSGLWALVYFLSRDELLSGKWYVWLVVGFLIDVARHVIPNPGRRQTIRR